MLFGIDYNETFAPVAKMVTLRILLTLVAIYSLSTGSLDVKTAFLNAPIKEDVWLKPPKELLVLLQALLKSTVHPGLGEKSRIDQRARSRFTKEQLLLVLCSLTPC